MVKIKKGNLTATVPYSTFKNHYEKLGWKIRTGRNKRNRAIEAETDVTVEIEKADDENYDDIDLATMNVTQLKAFAAENGIDVSYASSKKEMRAIIEETLNS